MIDAAVERNTLTVLHTPSATAGAFDATLSEFVSIALLAEKGGRMSKYISVLLIVLMLPGCAFYVRESYHGTATEEGRLYLNDLSLSEMAPALLGEPDSREFRRNARGRVYGPCVRDNRLKQACSRIRVDEHTEFRWE